ncbi:uncharacterized protein PHACADRAFT_189656 [Phanerochaete carnosa HHB-10118-sp]|uniref:Uncharacterized protein n=1 Tax=Phanerochaete carnosa (strain HHB-10118-sp) TaxID=650164 RepID=K5VC79_PHACS|nr:uncharacterized protein PHACADRAFT_189656 [Phanerochaete carnosa HHB-10118-sp]EKM60531.1 hypothetical protein PHACADRAFT_189656 [Phanerochaete carnosa HHB-10118-sp]
MMEKEVISVDKCRMREMETEMVAEQSEPKLSKSFTTLLLKESYLQDVSYVKQKVVCHPDCLEILTALWNDIISNVFVDLDKLHTATHTADAKHRETVQLRNGIELVATFAKISQCIESHGDWINAWDCYQDAVVFLYPHQDQELQVYRNYVNGLFKSLAISYAKQIVNINCYIHLQVAHSNCRLLIQYNPYHAFFPSKQVKLLLLWDELGIPHKQLKQIFVHSLTIIGFQVDSAAMTITLPNEA